MSGKNKDFILLQSTEIGSGAHPAFGGHSSFFRLVTGWTFQFDLRGGHGIFSSPKPAQTGPGALPATPSEYRVFFSEVKRPGRGVNHSFPSNNKVKERVELHLYSLSHLVSSRNAVARTLPLLLFTT